MKTLALVVVLAASLARADDAAAEANKTATKTGSNLFLESTLVGTIQRTKEKKIQVHIRGIWDVEHVNQNTTSADPNDLKGTWVYWRQD